MSDNRYAMRRQQGQAGGLVKHRLADHCTRSGGNRRITNAGSLLQLSVRQELAQRMHRLTFRGVHRQAERLETL